MHREVDRVLVGQRAPSALHRRIHVDGDVGRRRRVVPEGQRAVPVQQDRGGVGVRQNARDVGGGGEAADARPLLEPVRVGVLFLEWFVSQFLQPN